MVSPRCSWTLAKYCTHIGSKHPHSTPQTMHTNKHAHSDVMSLIVKQTVVVSTYFKACKVQLSWLGMCDLLKVSNIEPQACTPDPCAPHLGFIVPNGTASFLHKLGVVAALASVGAVAMVPHLLWYGGHEGNGKAHPDRKEGGSRYTTGTLALCFQCRTPHMASCS